MDGIMYHNGATKYIISCDIDLYYLQSRYYDADIGRFINVDAIEYLCITNAVLGNNLFSYCENDPINHNDQNGMWIQYAIGAAIGGILNVIFYIIDCKITKTKINVLKVLANFLNGAINGLIAAIGCSIIWQIVAGVANGLVSLFIGATKPTLEDFIIAIICGILSGILAGTISNGNNKHINYLMKNFGKKVKASVFKSGFGKDVLKAIKYVFKNCKTLLWNFIKSYCIPNSLICSIPRIKAVMGL